MVKKSFEMIGIEGILKLLEKGDIEELKRRLSKATQRKLKQDIQIRWSSLIRVNVENIKKEKRN